MGADTAHHSRDSSFFGSSKISVISLLSLMHLPSDAYNIYISSGILRQCSLHHCPLSPSFRFQQSASLFSRIGAGWNGREWSSHSVSYSCWFFYWSGDCKRDFPICFPIHITGTILSPISASQWIPMAIERTITSARRFIWQWTMFIRGPASPVHMDKIQQIKQRGFLRVGYNSNCIPFVFFNARGELVGYDVQMAYDLANFINVSGIEFVPITGETIASSLNQNLCDIVMSSVMVTRIGSTRWFLQIHTYRCIWLSCSGPAKEGFLEAGECAKNAVPKNRRPQ